MKLSRWAAWQKKCRMAVLLFVLMFNSQWSWLKAPDVNLSLYVVHNKSNSPKQVPVALSAELSHTAGTYFAGDLHCKYTAGPAT